MWDVFPTHEKIGGAPLNVALRLHSLGAKVNLISRTGHDRHGKELREFVAQRGLDTSRMQTDQELPTGRVLVAIDAKGGATYTIEQPVAWDRIAYNDSDGLAVAASDALIFGSLACRESVSRNTLWRLMGQARMKVFDVNLRTPHYILQEVVRMMRMADLIKLNDEELEEVLEFLDLPFHDLETGILELSGITGAGSICVTRGENGALLLRDGGLYANNGFKVKVMDTVGAGDSFLATLVFQLLSDHEPQKSLDLACAMGSIVASREGANPEITMEDIQRILSR